MSSRKTIKQRRIEELLNELDPKDIVIASELSRLGRSMKETLNIIESITGEKQAHLVLVKQNLDINPCDRNNITNKVLLTVFSMLAEESATLFRSERRRD